MTKYASTSVKRRNIKTTAEKKVQIAIDKMIDIIDLEVHYNVSELASQVLDKLRELESKISHS